MQVCVLCRGNQWWVDYCVVYRSGQVRLVYRLDCLNTLDSCCHEGTVYKHKLQISNDNKKAVL